MDAELVGAACLRLRKDEAAAAIFAQNAVVGDGGAAGFADKAASQLGVAVLYGGVYSSLKREGYGAEQGQVFLIYMRIGKRLGRAGVLGGKDKARGVLIKPSEYAEPASGTVSGVKVRQRVVRVALRGVAGYAGGLVKKM